MVPELCSGAPGAVCAKTNVFHFFVIVVHFVVRFLNPDLEDLGTQGPGLSLITNHRSRIRDRRPLAEQKTTSEQVWVPMWWGHYTKVPVVDLSWNGRGEIYTKLDGGVGDRSGR